LETYKNLNLLFIRSAFEVGDTSLGSLWSLLVHGQIHKRQPLSLGVFAGVESFGIYSIAGINTKTILVQPESGSLLTIRGRTFDKIAKFLV